MVGLGVLMPTDGAWSRGVLGDRGMVGSAGMLGRGGGTDPQPANASAVSTVTATIFAIRT